MDRAADAIRDRAAARAALRGKIATDDFDVFIGYNSADREDVSIVVEELAGRGIHAWIDTEQVLPGRSFQTEIQKARQLAL